MNPRRSHSCLKVGTSALCLLLASCGAKPSQPAAPVTDLPFPPALPEVPLQIANFPPSDVPWPKGEFLGWSDDAFHFAGKNNVGMTFFQHARSLGKTHSGFSSRFADPNFQIDHFGLVPDESRAWFTENKIGPWPAERPPLKGTWHYSDISLHFFVGKEEKRGRPNLQFGGHLSKFGDVCPIKLAYGTPSEFSELPGFPELDGASNSPAAAIVSPGDKRIAVVSASLQQTTTGVEINSLDAKVLSLSDLAGLIYFQAGALLQWKVKIECLEHDLQAWTHIDSPSRPGRTRTEDLRDAADLLLRAIQAFDESPDRTTAFPEWAWSRALPRWGAALVLAEVYAELGDPKVEVALRRAIREGGADARREARNVEVFTPFENAPWFIELTKPL